MPPQQPLQPQQPSLPPLATHTSRTLHYVVMAIIAVVLLGGGIAIGYFINQPQVNELRAQVAAQKKVIESGGDTSAQNQSVLSGAQQRARDTQRQTNINSLAANLEVYFNDYGGYPTFANITDDTWVAQNLPGLSMETFYAPGSKTNSYQATATPDKDHYGYITKNADGSACTGTTCARYELYWLSESNGKVYRKASLN